MSATAIDLSPILNLRMVKGVGDGTQTACAMHQAAILDAVRSGRSLDTSTDKLACACPVLRALLIRLNDGPWWLSDDERAEALRPLVVAILDTKSSRAVTTARARHIAMWALTVVLPMMLERAAGKAADISRQEKLREIAAKLRATTDLMAGRNLARKAADAYAYAYAYAAADAAAAYAAAAYAADAAAAYAAAAYAAADAYADAADAADAADDAAASRKSLRDLLITEWRTLAAISEQSLSTNPQRA